MNLLDDCVDGILLALDHAEHLCDVYNIASGEGRTIAEMVALVKDLIPGAGLSAGPGPLWYDDRLGVPPKGALDLSRAKRVLGYRPKYDLRRGLATYLEWYRRGQRPREN